jgi:chromosomal replication initiation ATPase DnaA
MGPFESGLLEHYRGVHQRLNQRPPPKVQLEEVALVPVETVENLSIPPHEEPIEVPRLTVRAITIAVCRRYHLRPSDIASPRRDGLVLMPRHIVCYLARRLTVQSMPHIGRILGGRDHTTILFAVNKIKRLAKDDMHLAAMLEDIERELTGGFAE